MVTAVDGLQWQDPNGPERVFIFEITEENGNDDNSIFPKNQKS